MEKEGTTPHGINLDRVIFTVAHYLGVFHEKMSRDVCIDTGCHRLILIYKVKIRLNLFVSQGNKNHGKKADYPWVANLARVVAF